MFPPDRRPDGGRSSAAAWLRRCGAAPLVCLGAALVAFVVHRIATTHGIGITPDAVAYLDVAGHLARGEGLVTRAGCTLLPRPLTHFPPLYPVVLSWLVRAGAEPMAAARLVAGLLFALEVAAVGWILLRSTGRPTVAGMGSLVTMAALPMLEVHTAAWSEPLFLVLYLAAAIGIADWLRRRRRRSLMLAAAALAGACLTRYAGVALVLGATLVLLFGDRPRPVRARLVGAAALATLALTPLAILLIHNARVTGDPVSRSPGLGSLTVQHAQALVRLAGSWVVPGSDRLHVIAAQDLVVSGLAVLVAAGLVAAWRVGRRASAPPPPELPGGDVRIPRVLGILAAVYAAFIVASIVGFRDDPPIVDQRLFAPVFLSLVIVGAHTLWEAHRRLGRRVRVMIAGAALVFILGHAVAGAAVVVHLREQGRGFASPAWRIPSVWTALGPMAGVEFVYSNHPKAVFFLSGRPACEIQRPGVLPGAPAAGQGVAIMNDRLARGQAALLVFHDARQFVPRSPAARGWAVDAGDAEQVAASLGLVAVARERNAVLYARR